MISTDNRVLARKIETIYSYVYSDVCALDKWLTRAGFYAAPGEYRLDGDEWQPISPGAHWRCGDGTTRWFATRFTLPQTWEGKTVVLELDFGGEGIVRINGEIRSAITSYLTPRREQRSRVLLATNAQAGGEYEIEIEAGLNYMEFSSIRARGFKDVEYSIRDARACVLDEEVEAYYFDANTALEALEVLGNPLDGITRSGLVLPRQMQRFLEQVGKDTYVAEKVRDALLRSLEMVDIDFDRESMVRTLSRAGKVLREALDGIDHSPHSLITFVGQAHIDTAWHWPLKETVRKCAKTLSNVVDLMDRYPELVFAFSQPQLFKYTKEYYPKLYERVKEKVKSGQFELVGNTWVEMDTNIPSGESLVRQILYGRNFFMQEFGKASDVFWMPDVFGYSWTLPQLIVRSGMKYFFTSKLVNNDTNRFPHSLFRWQGIDGTRVLAYLQKLNYNGVYCAECIDTLYSKFEQRHISDRLMMTYGYGDGGGGPNYQMMETGRRLRGFPGLQRTQTGTAQSFFDDSQEIINELPVWNDEMYYEFHRGTYTSQARTKKNNRKGEFLLRRAEIASVIAERENGREYPYQKLMQAYEILLTNQFHDIIPGSSIHDVYADADADYVLMRDIGGKLGRDAEGSLLRGIPSPDKSVIVFNYLSWNRDGIVTVSCGDFGGTCWCVRDTQGNEVPSNLEFSEDGAKIRFIARNVPAMGYAVYTLYERTGRTFAKVTVTPELMENECLRVKLDKNGNILSVFDKMAGRETLDSTQPSNQLQIFEDKPHGESAWNIDIEYQNKMWELNEADSVEIIEASPVRGVLRVTRKFNKSVITQDIILMAGQMRLDFETDVDWQETNKMLKAAFYPDILSPKATYEIQFGAIERPTHWNTTYDFARFEVCAHKWADISEGGYGVAVLNDCKYGYDIRDNRMRITLLRAPTYPDPTADKGRHNFVYSLYPHEGGWREGGVTREGYALNVPLEAAYRLNGNGGGRTGSRSFFQVENGNVVLDTVKYAEDGRGVIVRLYEAHGGRGTVRVLTDLGFDKATECNLVEEDEAGIPFDNGVLEFDIKPFEVRTFRLE